MDKTKEKTCGNCRFFMQHYVKVYRGFSEVSCGHCINSNINKIAIRKKNNYMPSCEHWQTMQIQTAERKIAIKERLEQLAKELEKVCEVIESDLNEQNCGNKNGLGNS